MELRRKTANAKLRVTSIGKVIQVGSGRDKDPDRRPRRRDVDQLLRLRVCTQYETQAPDVMNQLFPSRTIPLDSTYLAKADAVPGATGSSVSWTGPRRPPPPRRVRERLQHHLPAAPPAARGQPGAHRSSSFVDWFETGSLGITSVSDYQPCQVSLGSSTQLLAPTSTANGVGGYITTTRSC